MNWQEFTDKAYNALYKARWYPRIYLPNCHPTLVYAMGKSGTTTLRFTLYRHGIGPTFWAHSMNREKIALTKQYLESRNIKPAGTRFWQDRILERYIEKRRPLKIVTSMRDLVERDVSSFFQRFAHWNKVDVNQFVNRFEELQEMFHEDRNRPLAKDPWFDREIRDVIGLNVYDHPFPHEKGYQILKQDVFDILILRLETPDEIKEKALSKFFDVPKIKIYRANVSANKRYKNTYRDFIQYLKLPKAYVDSVYESRQMKHFYTSEEIALFREKWTVI